MPLPAFESSGDLPVGIHEATLEEVVARFGAGSERRRAATATLERVVGLAQTTGKLDRLIVFGSYVTAKPEPNDVDVVLAMHDDFRAEACPAEAHCLFDHREAEAALGASVFWVRPSMLFLETLEEFILHWQVKRDKTRRGIVEVKP
jgi:uncharacterized protein DUF6932